MDWGLLAILYIVCAALCAIGFYKFVYFLSVGYGLAVAGGGVAVLIMYLAHPSATPAWRSRFAAFTADSLGPAYRCARMPPGISHST